MPYCTNCGKEIPAKSTFCKYCGAKLASTTSAPPPPPPPTSLPPPPPPGTYAPTSGVAPPPATRPTGVTILAILEWIGGALAILGSLGTVAISGFAGAFGGFIIIMGIVSLVMGVASIVVGWGLWTLKKWAWNIALILGAIAIIISLASIVFNPRGIMGQILGLAINGAVIYYLTRPHIKACFQ